MDGRFQVRICCSGHGGWEPTLNVSFFDRIESAFWNGTHNYEEIQIPSSVGYSSYECSRVTQSPGWLYEWIGL